MARTHHFEFFPFTGDSLQLYDDSKAEREVMFPASRVKYRYDGDRTILVVDVMPRLPIRPGLDHSTIGTGTPDAQATTTVVSPASISDIVVGGIAPPEALVRAGAKRPPDILRLVAADRKRLCKPPVTTQDPAGNG
ncbi:MAG: hypothetical protein IPH00_00005 [Flavobacteriales bacterium]|nr:hypothetical protein [Flavobacteriales bacterium]